MEDQPQNPLNAPNPGEKQPQQPVESLSASTPSMSPGSHSDKYPSPHEYPPPPHNSYYPGQPHDEITQRVVFKHIISILPFMFAIFILSIVGIFGIYYVGLNEAEVNKFIPTSYVNIGGVLLVLILIFLFFGVLWIWRRNKIVITDQHIVDIDQMGLFNRIVSTLRLEEIQDISASVKGPMQTVFQYGSIVIQTAGERENFLFDYVPNPYELEHYVLEIRKKYYEPQDEGVKSPPPSTRP